MYILNNFCKLMYMHMCKYVCVSVCMHASMFFIFLSSIVALHELLHNNKHKIEYLDRFIQCNCHRYCSNEKPICSAQLIQFDIYKLLQSSVVKFYYTTTKKRTTTKKAVSTNAQFFHSILHIVYMNHFYFIFYFY